MIRRVASWFHPRRLHVTLTGIRGAFAPFLGMALYVGWAPVDLGPLAVPGFEGIGPGAFLVAASVGTAGAIGFYRLARKLESAGQIGATEPD